MNKKRTCPIEYCCWPRSWFVFTVKDNRLLHLTMLHVSVHATVVKTHLCVKISVWTRTCSIDDCNKLLSLTVNTSYRSFTISTKGRILSKWPRSLLVLVCWMFGKLLQNKKRWLDFDIWCVQRGYMNTVHPVQTDSLTENGEL
jgi:hypothetical protein